MTAYNSGTTPLELSAKDKRTAYILILGIILPLLDSTLVNLSVDNIKQYFHTDIAITQWITTAYMLAAATAVPLSAWLTEKITAKKTWVCSLSLFLIGTVLSAISINIHMLIFSRVIQGVATGLLLPVMQTIIVISVGQNKARLALTTMSVPSVLAPILGPLIAGLILQVSDWKMIFWLHIPLCLLSIYFAQKYLPSSKNTEATPFDYLGFIILSLGVISLILGINSLGTKLHTLTFNASILTTIGIVFIIIYIVYYKYKKENSIINLGLFKFDNFRNSGLLLLISSVVYYGGILFYPIFLIQYCNYSIFLSGIMIAFHGVGTLVGRKYIPKLTKKFGESQTLLISIVLTLIGSVLLIPQLIKYEYLVVIAMFFRGFGLGILTINSMSGAYEGLSKHQVSQASSLSRIFTYMGGVIGYSIIAYFLKNTDLENISPHLGLTFIIFCCFIPVVLNRKYNQKTKTIN